MRNTDVDSLLFPVEMVDVFFETPDCGRWPIRTHKAVINADSGCPLGVVGRGYRLVSNEEALHFGRQCARQLLGGQANNLEYFNVYAPARPYYCRVDLIHSGYEVNFGRKEIYLPFLRVTNSYNGSRALRFDIGYCRKLCSNGMIFEKEAIQFRFPHSHADIGREIDFRIAEGRLKALEARLTSDFDRLHSYPVPQEMAVPLFFRTLQLPFDGVDEEMPPRRRAYIDELVGYADQLIAKYEHELGLNAYAILNAATDFASNPPQIKDMRATTHSLQSRAGAWCSQFADKLSDEDKPFELVEYLGDYVRMAGWRN